ncbi:conserved hypothetical protein [Gloeothece citriformis PCC 7424]|uniref:Membrane-associated protein in eicosanoid and glutathione metabolism (MAPEG) n=1 Tax=Gloeothece citriformis (strain PCC 7424) TaxID=65393 RepID=B7KK90_GLOC7|nr:MAPEG family protein [Gloeothece citriformis]ACK70975.1 conserved hypothetical protein [Gloeothece citriformis PCC 7424]
MSHLIPISTLFIGLNGLIAFVLSYIVVMERSKTRLWHGESKQDVAFQSDPLTNPNIVATTVEKLTNALFYDIEGDEGALQRKVRAHANFTEYVPLALLFMIALELMSSPTGLIWVLGGSLTVARIAHGYGVIVTYGPSPGRAIGFFLTWFVYLLGAGACIYYGMQELI